MPLRQSATNLVVLTKSLLLGGKFEAIITRNTPVPVKKSQVYSTYADNQATVQIKVFEGEHAETKKNHHLGTFELSGIPMAARGVPQIEVAFSIDVNGIMRIAAQEIATGQSSLITIANEARLSEEEANRMIYEIDSHERQKAERIKTLKALNNLRQVVAGLERQLNDADKNMAELDKVSVRAVASYMSRWLNIHGGRATIDELEAKHDEALATSERYFGALGSDSSVATKARAKRNEL
ncbi:ATPase with role in protein import into the ER [Ceratobasidium sp. 394]|nr:ATPase with role in protein import into the ER [Ceratobasidium sp. 394]